MGRRPPPVETRRETGQGVGSTFFVPERVTWDLPPGGVGLAGVYPVRDKPPSASPATRPHDVAALLGPPVTKDTSKRPTPPMLQADVTGPRPRLP